MCKYSSYIVSNIFNIYLFYLLNHNWLFLLTLVSFVNLLFSLLVLYYTTCVSRLLPTIGIKVRPIVCQTPSALESIRVCCLPISGLKAGTNSVPQIYFGHESKLLVIRQQTKHQWKRHVEDFHNQFSVSC